MLAYPIATALLLLGQGTSAAATRKKDGARTRKPHPEKPAFMRKMDGHKKHARRRLSIKEFQAELIGDSKKSAELRKKVVEKSTMVKPPGGGRKLQNYNNYNNNNNGNDNNNYNANNANYDANNGNNDANNAYGYNGNYNQQFNNQFYNDANYAYNNKNNYVYGEDGNVQYKYDKNRDGADDYFQAYGEWENAFGFDPTQFSLSYHRCAAVRQFDDMVAAQEDTDSVFATKTFAIFRFCPAQTCMGWQEEEEEEWECDEDTYGEAYCEALEEYMEVMEENAANYQQYGNGWNGWNQNGGNDQANNWMNMNWGNSNGYNNGYNNGQQGMYYGQQGRYCQCEENAEEEEEQGEGDEQGNDGENRNCQCDDEDDDYYYGARGEGCNGNYGEYMMEMEEYLELMLEWQEERFEQYCMYCEECMFDVYEQWVKNGYQRGRNLSFEDFKNSDEHIEYRKLGNYYNVCPEYDTCSEYMNICQNGAQDEYSDYFECTEYESSSGQAAYVGPHCAEDGFTLSIGVFADEYCNQYIGNGVDIANFIGEEIDYEEDIFHDYYNSAFGSTLSQLKYINEDNVCIPCAEGDLLWTERGNGGDDDDDGNYDKGNEINELCENVYLVAARCDKHYRSYNNKSKQAKYAEAMAQEDLTCDFIDSIVMGNYNEMGEIDMGQDYTDGQRQRAWMANNMYAQQYGHYVTEVTPLQVFGLIASILTVCILGMWAMSLHKSAAKIGPWRPRRGLRAPTPAQSNAGAADVSRQNSGIVMGRSASNTSYYLS